MSNALAKEVTDPAEDLGRVTPEIDPERLLVNVDGGAFREILVRMPDGMIAADLGDPAIWKKVQVNRLKSLRKFDRLILVAFDERSLWQCWVSEAGPESVSLSTPVRHELKSRNTPYFSDGTYRVKWLGASFGIERIVDSYILPGTYPNEQLCINAIAAQYPKAV